MVFFGWFLVFTTLKFISVSQSFMIPPCQSPIIYTQGFADVTKTLINCSNFAPQPLMAPSIFFGAAPINVSLQILFNNLISVSDLQQSFTFDCYFRLFWYDNRYSINKLFSKVNTDAARNGLEMIDIIKTSGELLVWKPDIIFVDATEETIFAESLRLKPNGLIIWTRHIVVTLSEANFNYDYYPNDRLQAGVAFQSLSMPNNLLNLIPFQNFSNNNYYYNENDDNSNNDENKNNNDNDLYAVFFSLNNNKQYSFKNNPIWKFLSYEVKINEQFSPLGLTTVSRLVSQGYIILYLQRESSGIIIRFGVPILLVTLLGGFLFWLRAEERVSNSITLILTVSALYVVVTSSIPLVGYTTDFDKFVFAMFSILSVSVLMHLFYLDLMKKHKKNNNINGNESSSTNTSNINSIEVNNNRNNRRSLNADNNKSTDAYVIDNSQEAPEVAIRSLKVLAQVVELMGKFSVIPNKITSNDSYSNDESKQDSHSSYVNSQVLSNENPIRIQVSSVEMSSVELSSSVNQN
eukprot:gene10601-14241_t